jgi:hypothetical protein
VAGSKHRSSGGSTRDNEQYSIKPPTIEKNNEESVVCLIWHATARHTMSHINHVWEVSENMAKNRHIPHCNITDALTSRSPRQQAMRLATVRPCGAAGLH